jgi:hypothetical protein
MTLMNFAYDAGPEKLPKGQSVREFVREKLDALGIGADLMQIKVSKTKMLALPPSQLPGAPSPEAYPIIEARVYPRIGCADHQIKRRLDGRTRAARVLNGRSKPEGAEPVANAAQGKKQPLARERKKAAALARNSDSPTEPSG